VLDFPPDHHTRNRWYQALAVGHGKRIPYGVNLFMPEKFTSNHLIRTLIHCLRKPAVATLAREGGRPLNQHLQRPVPSLVDAGRAELVGWGYSVIVSHDDLLQPSESTCVAKTLGTGERVDGKTIYRLR
jgi:hypothetical protein